MKIGFLACPGTLPGSLPRREDAFEHDHQVDALRAAMAPRGLELTELDWRTPDAAFDDIPLALLGTVWDYQDHKDEFLTRIDALEARGVILCNSAEVVRWNIDKSYLKQLAKAGAPSIPTLWPDHPSPKDVNAAFDLFEADRVVVKRRVGAGAEGQSLHRRGDPDLAGWTMDRPAMIQPFLPAIGEEGEYSFVFIDGALSHCVIKRAVAGEYRIQSLYGGTEEVITPSLPDANAARAIVAALPFTTPPLYARIDMVRGPDGQLCVMEAEMIEPYLYPKQGPEFGERMATAIETRVNNATSLA